MNVSLRQLEYFLVLCEKLNFRKAAEACYVTQPALSSQIQLLEENLEVRLFERDRKKVLLTSEGAIISQRARKILSAVSDMESEARSLRKPFTGDLRIGVIPTIAPYVLPFVIPELSRSYPGLHLSFHEHRTDQLIQMASDNDLDLLLLALDVDLGDLESLRLYEDPFVLAVPFGHRLASKTIVSNADMKGQGILLLEDGHCMRDHALKVCKFSHSREAPDFSASSLSTLIAMVAAGNGITLLPTMAVAADRQIRQTVDILDLTKNAPKRTIGFAWRSTCHRGGEFHQLADLFRKWAPKGAII